MMAQLAAAAMVVHPSALRNVTMGREEVSRSMVHSFALPSTRATIGDVSVRTPCIRTVWFPG